MEISKDHPTFTFWDRQFSATRIFKDYKFKGATKEVQTGDVQC